MKMFTASLLLALLAGLGCVGASVPHTGTDNARDLNSDFAEFYALIPEDQVVSILLDFIASDPTVGPVFDFLSTVEFYEILKVIEDTEEFIALMNFYRGHRLDVDGMLSSLHDMLGLPPYIPFKNLHHARTNVSPKTSARSFVDFVVAALQTISLPDFIKLYEQKLQTSPEFAALVADMKSPEYKNLVRELETSPYYMAALGDLANNGLELSVIIAEILYYFTW